MQDLLHLGLRTLRIYWDSRAAGNPSLEWPLLAAREECPIQVPAFDCAQLSADRRVLQMAVHAPS